jgi:hypothetical protein
MVYWQFSVRHHPERVVVSARAGRMKKRPTRRKGMERGLTAQAGGQVGLVQKLQQCGVIKSDEDLLHGKRKAVGHQDLMRARRKVRPSTTSRRPRREPARVSTESIACSTPSEARVFTLSTRADVELLLSVTSIELFTTAYTGAGSYSDKHALYRAITPEAVHALEIVTDWPARVLYAREPTVIS